MRHTRIISMLLGLHKISVRKLDYNAVLGVKFFDVIIPQANQNLGTPINIQEFYVWLGCIFYMACFQGIGDRNQWWSSAPIDQFKGAPFWLRFTHQMVGQSSVHHPLVRGRGQCQKAPAEPMLDFQRQLAKMMLENRLDTHGVAPNSSICPRRVSNTHH